MRRTIVRPAGESVENLKANAGGDFSHAIRQSTEDEIGMIAASAEALRKDVSQVLKMVEASAGEINEASARLSSAAMEQMTISIASVAENAETVNPLSHQSQERTDKGNHELSKLIGETGSVENAVEEIASSVSQSVRRTGVIATMTQQVREIADQSSLRALNAAIEAARAGEQGRGFAVVADEVRKLAEKSAQSASQIDQVTVSLSQQSVQVEQTVRQGQQSLATSQDHLEQVAMAHSEARQSVIQASQGVGTIASATSGQKSASSEIARNVEHIARMAEQNGEAVKENDAEVGRMEQLARALQETVSRFRL